MECFLLLFLSICEVAWVYRMTVVRLNKFALSTIPEIDSGFIQLVQVWAAVIPALYCASMVICSRGYSPPLSHATDL